MHHDPSAPSSDLERARAISRRLRGPRRERPVAPTASPARPRPAAEPPTRSPAGVHAHAGALPLDVLESGNLGSRFWNDVLSQCLELASEEGASGVFAVDGQGLGIAQIGDFESGQMEATGSRLVIALEQAARMESFSERGPGSILIEFGSQWLTGLAVQRGDGQVVVGVVAREPLSQRTRQLLSNLLAETLLRA